MSKIEVQNFRACPDNPKVCGTCKHLKYDGYASEICERLHPKSFSSLDGSSFFYTCDLWKPTEPEEKKEEGSEY